MPPKVLQKLIKIQNRLKSKLFISSFIQWAVAVNFIHTDGCNFHFSAYQLNTLNLEDSNGIKNIFWHEEDMSRLFDVCDYVKAVPVLSGYNPEVFSKFAAMYLQNIE